MEIIQPAIKNYAWAEKNKTKNICNHFQPTEYEPISELWFGTHHQGHAYIHSTGELLQDYIGMPMNSLFKLLSVGKPLSIQVHPDKQDARILHESNPYCYPDPHEKPEIAIAISDKAYAFCGIQPFENIRNELLGYFSDVFDVYIINQLQPTSSEDRRTIIRNCLINLYEMPEHKYRLLSRRLHRKNHVFRYLEQAFPDDRGCAVCVLFLNFMSLQKYDAICIHPNVIHCYIAGNFFECMTTSNNVIRVGLTSKYIDYSTFFKIASFQSHDPEYFIIRRDHKPQIFSYKFDPLPLIQVIDTALEPKQSIDIDLRVAYQHLFIVVLRGDNLSINNFLVDKHKVYVLRAVESKNPMCIANDTHDSLDCSIIVISI